MKLIFTAICVLSLAVASLWMHYDILALDQVQVYEPGFLIAVGMIALACVLLVQTFLVKAPRPSIAPVVKADVQDEDKQRRDILALQQQLKESEARCKTLEVALRDVEARLAAESAKKAQAVTSPDIEAQVIQFLARLQERGRFVDFLMQDVQSFGDEQVGRAARVVHQGCRGVLQEMFSLAPLTEDGEGQTVRVEAGEAQRFRLIGAVSGNPPYHGRLLHRGWRTGKINLPSTVEGLRAASESLPGYVVAPAEVELSA